MPYGYAKQSLLPEALNAVSDVAQGHTLYKIGSFGKSEAAESQFWSLEDPSKFLNNPEVFAKKYGIPAENLTSGNMFIIKGQMKAEQNFISRPAPGVGENGEGSIEVVADPGAVSVQSFQKVKN